MNQSDTTMSSETVLDAFFIFSLLNDFKDRNQPLSVPHRGLHKDRLDDILTLRNYETAGTGQEMWAHSCSRCLKVFQNPDGEWRMFPLFLGFGVLLNLTMQAP